ncbi:MAG: hypothetical protein ACXACW_05170 [Candidatus Hodarchaeales archaeon]|jgi:hypothetical protein
MSFLINPYILGSGGEGIIPSIRTNLEYQLDAQTGVYSDGGTTLAGNGDSIEQIDDQSGNGIIANNLNTLYQVATYSTGSIGTKNTIRVQLSGNANEAYTLSSNVNVTNNYTFHVIYKKDSASDESLFIRAGTTYFGDEDSDQFYTAGGIYATFGSRTDYNVVTIRRSAGIDGEINFYENGMQTLKDGSVSINPTSLSFDGIFQRGDKIGNFNVADMLIYSNPQNHSDIKTIHEELNTKYNTLFLPIDTSLPTPPTIGSTTLEWYHNPDYNTYSDISKTLATNLDFVRGSKITTDDLGTIQQETASVQMQYKTTVLPNGKASFYKGGQDYMFMSEDKVFTPSESFVAYSVHKREVADGSNAIFGSSGSNNAILEWTNTVSVGRVYFGDNGGITAAAVPFPTTNTVVRAYVIDRTLNEFRVYQNGTEIGNVDISVRNQNATFTQMFNRGSSGTGLIDHGITLLYRGLHDDTDVVTVSDWLNDYYGDEVYSSTPPITSNLVAHYQADANNTYIDAGVTEAVDGNNIQQINDVSGNNNHLTQTTVADQLVFKTNELKIAGNRYWQASGSTFMDLTNSIFVDQSVGFTTFFVVQKSASTEKAIPFGGDITQASVGNWWNDSFVYCGGGGTYPRVGNSYTSDWRVIAVTYGLNANEIRVHNNSGYNGAQTLSAFSDFDLTAAFNFGLSGDRHSDNDVKYAEMLHYNQPMSDADVISISDWLVSRHNI